MSEFLFTNNAQTTLAASISNVALNANLAVGSGVLFPNPGAGQYFPMTFTDAATGLLNEIVYVTARTGDNITMIRAQESTTALGWNAGDVAALLVTAGSLASFGQLVDVQAQGYIYAVDSGAANAYVVAFNPGLTARLPGADLHVKFVHANSGTAGSTINDGVGVVNLKNLNGSLLAPGQITANMQGTVAWDGTQYILKTPATPGVPASSGRSAPSKFSATASFPITATIGSLPAANRFTVTGSFASNLQNSNGTIIAPIITFTIKDGATVLGSFGTNNQGDSIPSGYSSQYNFSGSVNVPAPVSGAYSIVVSDDEGDGAFHTYTNVQINASASPIS